MFRKEYQRILLRLELREARRQREEAAKQLGLLFHVVFPGNSAGIHDYKAHRQRLENDLWDADRRVKLLEAQLMA